MALLREKTPARDFSKQKMPTPKDIARDLRLHLCAAGARPLARRHGRWLPLDWAAEFPQLVDPIREVTDADAEAWLDRMTR